MSSCDCLRKNATKIVFPSDASRRCNQLATCATWEHDVGIDLLTSPFNTTHKLPQYLFFGDRLDVWKLDEDPIPPADCARRGVLDKSVLPYYPYRDDAVAVYYLIEKYVRTVVRHFYGLFDYAVTFDPEVCENLISCLPDSPDKIEHDYELQNWAAELVKPREEGGLGLNVGHDSFNGILVCRKGFLTLYYSAGRRR